MVSDMMSNAWVRWDTGYRLPTEAEWERAARGGTAGRRFPWSDVQTIQHERANYFSTNTLAYDTSPTRGYHPTYYAGDIFPLAVSSSPVGSFAANGYGLYDMAGNVSEWCWDRHDQNYYASSPGTNPRGADGWGFYLRVVRGGNFCQDARHCRVAHRFVWDPVGDSGFVGFRVVRPVTP